MNLDDLEAKARAAAAAIINEADALTTEQRHDAIDLFEAIVTSPSSILALIARLRAAEAVVQAACAWSASFGELSKRLPPHVHALRDAVDAYEDLSAKATP